MQKVNKLKASEIKLHVYILLPLLSTQIFPEQQKLAWMLVKKIFGDYKWTPEHLKCWTTLTDSEFSLVIWSWKEPNHLTEDDYVVCICLLTRIVPENYACVALYFHSIYVMTTCLSECWKKSLCQTQLQLLVNQVRVETILKLLFRELSHPQLFQPGILKIKLLKALHHTVKFLKNWDKIIEHFCNLLLPEATVQDSGGLHLNDVSKNQDPAGISLPSAHQNRFWFQKSINKNKLLRSQETLSVQGWCI